MAELAAQGLANKEIAGALVVTINTVEFHLSNTYAKLGVAAVAVVAFGFLGLNFLGENGTGGGGAPNASPTATVAPTPSPTVAPTEARLTCTLMDDCPTTI